MRVLVTTFFSVMTVFFICCRTSSDAMGQDKFASASGLSSFYVKLHLTEDFEKKGSEIVTDISDHDTDQTIKERRTEVFLAEIDEVEANHERRSGKGKGGKHQNSKMKKHNKNLDLDKKGKGKGKGKYRDRCKKAKARAERFSSEEIEEKPKLKRLLARCKKMKNKDNVDHKSEVKNSTLINPQENE